MSHACDRFDPACAQCVARQHASLRAAMTSDDALDDIKRAQMWSRIEDRIANAELVRAQHVPWHERLGLARRWWMPLAVAAAAVVALVVQRSPRAPELASAPAFVAPRDTTLSLTLGHARAALVGPARLEVVDAAPQATTLELREGTLLAEFEGGTGRQLHIRARGVTIEIVGTLFGVELLDASTCVSVAHGTVRMTANGETRRISDGQRACAPARPPAPSRGSGFGSLPCLPPARCAPSTATTTRDGSGAPTGEAVDDIDDAMRAALARHARMLALAPTPAPPALAMSMRASTPAASPPATPAPTRAATPPAVSHTPVHIATRPSAPPLSERPNPGHPASPSPASPSPASPSPVAPPVDAPRAPVAPTVAAPVTAASLYHDAELALAARDLARADRHLADLVAQFPESPLLDQAIYERARIAYQRRAWADAQRQLDRLALLPASPLAEPGAYLACRIAHEAHDGGADACWVQYRARYPRAPHDIEVLGLLVELAHRAGGCAAAAPRLVELAHRAPDAAATRSWRARCPEHP